MNVELENTSVESPTLPVSDSSDSTLKKEEKTHLSNREKELLIRDLEVRSALMELKVEQRELIEKNDRLNDREKSLLLRDLEVRSMLMEVKVTKEELMQKNDQLANREKELVLRDLEVRTVLMELKIAQEQLVERHSELETLMNIVKEINNAQSLEALLQVMLSQLLLIIPKAEKGAFLRYHPEEKHYTFAAVFGYTPEQVENVTVKRPDLEAFYMNEDMLVAEGFYVVNRQEDQNTEKRENLQYIFERPQSALVMTVTINGVEKGLVFLDNFTITDAFKTQDVDKLTRFREHIISAFSRMELLDTVKKQNALAQEYNRSLHQTLAELQEAQDRLVLTEKMAALGQVIANMAHEINTPIAAINAASLYILNTLPPLLEKLPHIFKELTEEQETLFFELVAFTLRNVDYLSTQTERKYRKEIEDELRALNLELYQDHTTIARDLVRCGVWSNVAHFIPLFQNKNFMEVINAAALIGKVRLHVNNIVYSVNKTQRAVLSYKTYTEDSSGQREGFINLSESVEQSLNTYRTINTDRLSIQTDLDELMPSITCYPDQLSQVWAHLIHNALQAMENKGVLKVKTYIKAGYAHAEFTDSGPGIPKEIQDRIFEPFFTTRPEGEGGGLGLHVCQKIIRAHFGKIEFETEPGQTTFRVSIPYDKFKVISNL